MISRFMPVIYARDLPRLRDFYRELLELELRFDSDWYVHLVCPANPRLELGLHHRGHAGLPPAFRALPPGGAYLSLQVDNVHECSQRAQGMGAEILDRPDKPGTEHYDRLRLLLRDPEGCLLELMTPTDPQEALVSEYIMDQ